MQQKNLIGPILFFYYYEKSLVSSNLNSNLLCFHCVQPNDHANFLLIPDLRKEKMCSYCHHNPKMKQTPLKPERWKTLLAFLYVLLVSWVTAFVMVIVHDRVPDMEKYPPLPDIILDNVPHIPWVRLKCDYLYTIQAFREKPILLLKMQ